MRKHRYGIMVGNYLYKTDLSLRRATDILTALEGEVLNLKLTIGGTDMPTIVNAHPTIAAAVKEAGGQIVRSGSKPWAHFRGPDAAERARTVLEAYKTVHGYEPDALRPWLEGQNFDYAVRLD